MVGYYKWIGAIIGFMLPIPFGLILGYFVGMFIDNSFVNTKKQRPRTQPRYTNQRYINSNFVTLLIVCTASMMKADGKVTNRELDFVKAYYKRIFGLSLAQDFILRLRDVLKRPISPLSIVNDTIHSTSYHERLQLLHFLFGIAASDGEVSQSEYQHIVELANSMRLSQTDFDSIKSMFVDHESEESMYAVLGVPTTASNEEIKKAYRKKAVEYHPDKVAHLGKDIQESAKEKFQSLTEAYNKIKKKRNF